MANTATTDGLYWDPFDTEIDADPYQLWRRMRDEAPVYHNDRFDFFALSRFDDVEAAHRDPGTFSSAHGIVLERMSPKRGETRMMIMLDQPDHTSLRSLVSRAFSPRRVAALEPEIRNLCATLLDPFRDADSFDYVADFAAQLPSRVISTLVGVPPEEQERARRLVDGMFHIEPGVGMANQTAMHSALELAGFLAELISARRTDPLDDLITALVQAEMVEDGVPRRLTDDECLEFVILLYTAGTETVAKLLGNAAVVLAEHPDQREILAADPSVIPNAIEELLRFEAPSPVQGRWTERPIALHGVEIPADSKVLLLTGAAGRDERVFAEPDRFDVQRKIAHHVSFGYGIHFCIGAALARLEGRIGLEETLRRFPTWALDRDGVRRVHTSTVRGYRNVAIRPKG